MTGFYSRFREATEANRSLLCVGLDPDPDLMAVPDVTVFNAAIVDATKDLACAYKPNLSFYEALGIGGLRALERTIRHIRVVAPQALIIGDAKRGDITSSNRKYAAALFDVWGFDAATVNAYVGGESLEPFLGYRDRGVLILCRSSNAGAGELQDLALADSGGRTLYEWVATSSAEWNVAGNLGLVVGATYPHELAQVRNLAPGMPILVPGVGAQSGQLEASVRSGLDSDHPNLLISSSRGITYASRNPQDFRDAAREAALCLKKRIDRVLALEDRKWS